MAWLIIVAGFMFCRFSFLEDVIYNVDEAEYAVAADGLKSGELPGVDLLGSTKPPGIAALYLLLFEAFGRSMMTIHIAHLVMIILSGLLIVELAISVMSASAAIPAALSYVALCNSYATPAEMLALNVESPGMLLALAALLLSLRHGSITALLISGLLFGMGSQFRQSIILFSLVAVFWPPLRGMITRRIIFIGCGILLAWLPLILWYAVHNGLGWAYDSWVRYPTDYAGDLGWIGFFQALSANFAEFIPQSLFILLFVVAGLYALLKNYRATENRGIAIWFLISSVALCTGSRFFGHYFYQFYPVLAIIAAGGWLFLVSHGKFARVAAIAMAAFAVMTCATHFPNWYARESWWPPRGVSFYRLGRDQLELGLSDYIRANSTPQDRITVWGYCPQIYYLSNRLPATRDYLCHYVTGYSPLSFDPMTQKAPRANGHPEAEQMFRADLEQNKPRFVVDLVRVVDYDFPFIQYSLLDYPLIADYLRAHYEPDHAVGEALVYRRRDS